MSKSIDLKFFRRIYPTVLVFMLPWCIFFVLSGFLIPFLKEWLKEIIAFGLFSFILLSIVVCINNWKIKKALSLIFLSLLSVLVIVKLSFYYHYGVKLSASAWFVILETYTAEALDFLWCYLDDFTIALIILFLLLMASVFLLSWIKRPFYKSLNLRLPPVLKLLLLLICSFSVYVIHLKFERENILAMSISSYTDYKAIKEQFKTELAQNESDQIEVISANKSPQTYIVIIGESTSNWHMQLYGYDRETNPQLNEIKEELLVFDSVIAPNVHTILSLEKILTFSDYQHQNRKNNASIVQLANEAGFETYWLSSQRPIGFHESVAATIARASDQAYYTNTEDSDYQILDENLLPKLDDILNDNARKRLIFVHLIGTHMPYKKRYPKDYEFFENNPKATAYPTKKSFESINTYDNAVRYNDMIVRSIIERLRLQETISYVCYFSDHGDEVFDTMDFLGHNEYHATRPMYEVPFLVWFSEAYKTEVHDYSQDTSLVSRPYNLENFIYGFSEISQIQFKGFQPEKSIFNPQFTKRIRWIKDQVDYDNR